jgi:peptidoglycan-N-acetylglucosamine deacetylase
MNILTFDIEEWFHVLDNDLTKEKKQWLSFESRIEKNMQLIFEILDKSNTSATFFVLGWIAEKYPEIVKSISKRGFEIGSHTHLHQLAYTQDYNTFYEDVKKSIFTLEDCTGKKVRSFRAPGFSITSSNKWAFEVLSELGIEIDSSVFPSIRQHGGMPSYPKSIPSILEYNGVLIKEFPINTFKIFKNSLVFSGGGYFRLLPYFLIKKFTNKSNYVMSYFHPRDFDFQQPLIPGLTMQRRLKSYVGLKNCQSKLEKWLDDFDFVDIEQANQSILWEQMSKVKI